MRRTIVYDGVEVEIQVVWKQLSVVVSNVSPADRVPNSGILFSSIN